MTVGPTKPLMPSHLRVLLAMDVLHRATETFADVTHLYHPTAHAGSRQVAGLWEYLDRLHPGLCFDTRTEEEIGELYRDYQASDRVPYAVLEPVVRRAETGWIHPATARLLDIWEDHYRTLGLRDPGFGRAGPELMPAAELIDLLVRNDLCVDGRPYGAPVYLDATAAGLPLRVMIGADGQANYLMSTLRELVPQLATHDHVVLTHDPEIRADYRTITHILTVLGAEVSRFELSRVPINGVARSTRYGGWQGYTLDAFAKPLVVEAGEAAFALGMRLYLISGLAKITSESFTAWHLRRWVGRAHKLLTGHGAAPAREVSLAMLAARLPYADPYKVMATLLSKEPVVPQADLLDVVLGPGARVPTLAATA